MIIYSSYIIGFRFAQNLHIIAIENHKKRYIDNVFLTKKAPTFDCKCLIINMSGKRGSNS